MWSLRWDFTNKSVTGAPCSIKRYSLSHSWTLMVKSMKTETVPSWGHGGTAKSRVRKSQVADVSVCLSVDCSRSMRLWKLTCTCPTRSNCLRQVISGLLSASHSAHLLPQHLHCGSSATTLSLVTTTAVWLSAVSAVCDLPDSTLSMHGPQGAARLPVVLFFFHCYFMYLLSYLTIIIFYYSPSFYRV